MYQFRIKQRLSKLSSLPLAGIAEKRERIRWMRLVECNRV